MISYRARRLKSCDYCTEWWSGGQTTELSIEPDEASYKNRKFLWRISSASVELEKSTFTSLPDYDRVIMTLKGELQLSHDRRTWRSLKAYEPYFFDGGLFTESRGQVTDFNLMMRKGDCTGFVRALKIGSQEQKQKNLISFEEFWQALGPRPADTLLFYCIEGLADARLEQGQVELQAGESLRLDRMDNLPYQEENGTILSLSGEAVLAAAAICREI